MAMWENANYFVKGSLWSESQLDWASIFRILYFLFTYHVCMLEILEIKQQQQQQQKEQQ